MSDTKRIFILGDELVAGSGDPRALGWVGRVIARSKLSSPAHTLVLAKPGQSTVELAESWEVEVGRRYEKTAANHLVVGLGIHDGRTGYSTVRSRLALANILDGAHNWQMETLVVGPPPLPHMSPDQILPFAQAWQEVCQRRGITYVDTFSPLVNNLDWLTDVQSSPLGLPQQAGYGMLAWLVLNAGWQEFLGE